MKLGQNCRQNLQFDSEIRYELHTDQLIGVKLSYNSNIPYIIFISIDKTINNTTINRV